MREFSKLSNKGKTMKKISIFSEDKRFLYAKELFSERGYECALNDLSSLSDTDALLLSVAPADTEEWLSSLLPHLNGNATVFTGSKDKVSKLFDGRVIAYSDSEAFLLKNAYITALCAIRLTFERIDSLLLGKKALLLGYGRIGKYLSSMLRSLGADVFVYARSEKSKAEAFLNGMKLAEISEIPQLCLDAVYNTVPDVIVEKSISDNLCGKSLIMELASLPGGFEDRSAAIKASGLPGKMMPRAAAEAICDLVLSVLSEEQE